MWIGSLVNYLITGLKRKLTFTKVWRVIKALIFFCQIISNRGKVNIYLNFMSGFLELLKFFSKQTQMQQKLITHCESFLGFFAFLHNFYCLSLLQIVGKMWKPNNPFFSVIKMMQNLKTPVVCNGPKSNVRRHKKLKTAKGKFNHYFFGLFVKVIDTF